MCFSLSIIVPVYNVENYLDRCIKSLLNQTIDGYNIILVDDGSTDNSGKICDDWAVNSEKIIAFHKPNGGLSDARNFGVKHTNAKYVAFIDSDDYVEPQYVEILFKGLDLGADIVVSHHVQEKEGALNNVNLYTKYEVYSVGESLKKMCYEEISTSACGKLFPRIYIEEDPFPVGKLYEDLLTVYKYIGKAKKIAFNRSQTYHYVQRNGSIRQSKWDPRFFDVMEGANNLLHYIDKNYPAIHVSGLFRYFYSANELYVRAFSSPNYLKVIKPVRTVLKKYIMTIVIDHDTSMKYKIQFLLMALSPKLYRKAWIMNKDKSNYAEK